MSATGGKHGSKVWRGRNIASRRNRSRRRSHLVQLAAEALEPRRLLAVSVADLTVNEGDGVAQVVVTNTPISSSPVSFDISTAGNTATGNLDYRIRFASLTIPANQPSVTFDVNILEDDLIENDEQFIVNITSVNGTTIDDGRAFVTIQDNDSNPATLSVADLTVDEDAGVANVIVSLSEAPTTAVSVIASTSSGTAQSGIDFVGASTTLAFLPGVTSQTFSVNLIDDSDVESEEQFFVTLGTPNGATIDDGTAVVTIEDDDGGGGGVGELVGIDFDPLGTSSPLNWTLFSNVSTDFSATNLIDETGTLTNIDLAVAFGGGSGQGTFNSPAPAQVPSHTNSLANIDGVLVEDTELTFTFSDLIPGNDYEVFLFGGDTSSPPFSQSVTITGAGTVGPFVQSWSGNSFVNQLPSSSAALDSFAVTVAADGAGQIILNVQEVGPSDFAVVQGLAIREIDAATPPAPELIGVDFSVAGTSVPVNWTQGTQSSDFTLSNLIDESGAATSVNLDVAFDGGGGLGPFVRPDPSPLPVHDNPLTGIGGLIVDQVSLTFTYSGLNPNAEYDVFVVGGDENTTFSHEVTITGATTAGPFTQNWDDETFINRDLVSASPLDSFAETVTSTSLGEIVITVSESAPTSFAVVQALAIRERQVIINSVVSIEDAVVDEAAGSVLLTARLSEPSTDEVRATIESSSGTATSGEDFLRIFQTLIFAPGTTELVFAVPILDDHEVEGDEQFTVNILAAENANLGTGATVTIVGDEFRTIDGTLNQPDDKGAADTQVIRFGYPHGYVDAIGDDISELKTEGLTANPSFTLPNPRDVSNAVMAQSGSVLNDRNLSDWIVQWGQFVTHDMDLTINGSEFNVLSTGATGDFNIPLQAGDPLGQFIPFNRSKFDPTTGNATPRDNGEDNSREQINEITSFIDASNVYGSDPARAAALRTFLGGKLRMSANDLLDFNTFGLENDNGSPLPDDQLFLAGDVRSNEQIGLTAIHTIFAREHNRLADLIAADNPSFTDEQIYQWARRIVGAQMQIITYEEFLPALMGNEAPDPFAVEDREVDPSITNSFANAFFRYGHSMQSPVISLVDDDDQQVGALSLRDAFFQPNLIVSNPAIIDLTLKGLASQAAQENDILLVDDIRNFLFGPPGAGGLDLGALDLQRGRDHGLLAFNEFRLNYGLPRVTSFAELTSDPVLQAELQSIYGDINHVESFVGGLAEDHVPGTSVGSMLVASLQDQFSRLRDGDQFFYTVDPSLQSSVVTSAIDLSSFRLSTLIRNNTGIQNIHDDVFFTPSSVSGQAFLDGNANGLREPNESVLAGVTVFVDGNLNGSLDVGERSDVTDGEGFYQIQGLSDGAHVVAQVLPAGFTLVSPQPNPTHDITLLKGQNLGGQNFGYDTTQSFDFGDAPAPFPVTLAEDGARHAFVIGGTGPLFRSLSASIDGQHSPFADGDDFDDGITFGDLLPGTSDNVANVSVSRAAGRLDAWIDFNQDNDWDDPGEQIFDNLDLDVATHALLFSVPENAIVGDTFARFRLSTHGDLSPAGAAVDGEVEDYLVSVSALPLLSAIGNTGTESAGTLTLSFSTSQPIDRDVTFEVSTFDGQAIAGDDYVEVVSHELTILAGEQLASIDVALVDDDVFEDTESFGITIGPSVNAKIGVGSAFATILDDDVAPVVQLFVGDTELDENTDVVAGIVSINKPTGADTSVDLVFAGSATSGVDYTGELQTITIPRGQTQATFNLTSIEDEIDEINETIEISLQNPVHATLGSPNQQTIEIVDDDDAPIVTLTITPTAIDEDLGTATGTISLDAISSLPVTVSLATSGTATATDDYVLSDASFTILPGNTQAVFTITGEDDDLFEDPETVTVEISNVTNAREVEEQSVDVTINSEESFPQVSLSLDPHVIDEGQAAAGTVSIDVASAFDVVVELNVDGTADANDFNLLDSTVTIPAGLTSAPFAIDAFADLLDEADETVTVSIQSVSNATDVSSPQSLTILDIDDAPNISMTVDITNLDEAEGVLTGTVSLAAPSGLTVSAGLDLSGNAVAADFEVTGEAISFAPGETVVTFSIQAVDDTLFEGNETLVIDLANVDNAIENPEQQATVTIVDNDLAPALTLTLDAVEANEGELVTGTVSLDTVSALPVMVDLVTGGVASSVDDFILSPTTVAIAAGETSADFTITLIDDPFDEFNETLTIALEGLVNAREISDQKQATLIRDNDEPPAVSLQLDRVSILENGGVANGTVSIDQVSRLDVTVALGLAGDAVIDEDFLVSATSLTIPAGSTEVPFTITAVGDVLDEVDEAIVVTFADVSNAQELVSQSATLAVLDDDDPPIVSLSFDEDAIDENGGRAVGTVSIDAPSSLPITVEVAVDGTADDAVDFSLPVTTVMIAPGETEATFEIVGLDDQLHETDENILVSFSSLSNVRESVAQQATITIIDDDDPPVVSLALDAEQVDEGGTVTGSVQIDGVSALEVVVELGLAGTAMSGDDFTAPPTLLTITPGETEATFTIDSIQDGLDELNETVIVSFSSVQNAGEASPQEQLFTIVDVDEAPNVSLALASTSIDENGGLASGTVSIDAVSGLDVTAILDLSGVAIQGQDYDASPITVVIEAGSTEAGFVINAANDDVHEGDEVVNVGLGSLTNANELVDQLVSVTIEDDDLPPNVALSLDQAAIAENGGVAIGSLTLDTVSDLDVSLDLQIAGSASQDDFTVSTTTITIPAGETVATFEVSGVDDSLHEGDERIDFDIVNTVNVVAPLDVQVSVTIADDDLAPNAVVSVAQASIEEAGGVGTGRVTLDAPSGLDAQIELVLTGAASDADYTISTSSLTIPAGETFAEFTLTSLDDALFETNELIVVGIESAGNATFSPDQQVVTAIIDDEDPPQVSLAVSAESIEETGSATVTIELDAVSALDVGILLEISGSASEADVEPITTEVTIPAGETSATISVSAIDDDVDEADESVEIGFASVANGAITDTAIVITILDNDDPPAATAAVDQLVINENAGVSVLTVSLASVSELDSTFDLDVTGSAVQNVDFSISDMQLIIPAGETSVSTSITGIDNLFFEADKSIELSLTGPGTDGESFVVTIAEDEPEPTVAISLDADAISEGTTTSIVATLSAVAPVETTVVLEFATLTTLEFPGGFVATEQDFLSETTIVIPAGTLSGLVTLTAVDDVLYERNETLTLDVLEVSTGYEVTSDRQSLTILDNDQGGFTVTADADPILVGEGGVSAVVSVVLTTQPFEDVVIGVDVSDPSEANVSETELTFTIENWNTPRTVTVTGVADLPEDGDVPFDVTFAVNAEVSDPGFDLSSQLVAGVNANVSVTDLLVDNVNGEVVIRNRTSGEIVPHEPGQGTPLSLDLSDVARSVQVGQFGDFSGMIELTHQADDVVQYGDGWTADPPAFVAGAYTHVIKRESVTIHVMNETPYQNPYNKLDTNRDGNVTALDALVGINFMGQVGGSEQLPDPVEGEELPEFYYDVSGDRRVTALDSLRVINGLGEFPSASSEFLAPQVTNDASESSEVTVEQTLVVNDAVIKAAIFDSPDVSVRESDSTEPSDHNIDSQETLAAVDEVLGDWF